MNLYKKVDKDKFYLDFVNILNGVLQLSNREVEVLSYLFKADSVGFEGNVNDRKIRDIIKTDLGISEANLSRYLSTIKEKGLIVKNDKNKWVINDNIKPTIEYNEELKKEEVKINFILILNKKKTNVEKSIKINSAYSKGVS
jgi:predicted transcriptional regulator